MVVMRVLDLSLRLAWRWSWARFEQVLLEGRRVDVRAVPSVGALVRRSLAGGCLKSSVVCVKLKTDRGFVCTFETIVRV